MLEVLADYILMVPIVAFILFVASYVIYKLYLKLLGGRAVLSRRACVILLLVGTVTEIAAVFLMTWAILSIKQGAPARLM